VSPVSGTVSGAGKVTTTSGLWHRCAHANSRLGCSWERFDYGDPGRLDIHAESPLVVQQATAGIYSGLLHHDPAEPGKVVGDLAERWTASPDGKTYTSHTFMKVWLAS
jgi:ABC-type transport system substrate-binding protein